MRLSHARPAVPPLVRCRRGITSFVVLAGLFVVAVLAFTMMGRARFANVSSHRVAFGDAAQDLAESGLAVLITRLRENAERTGKILMVGIGPTPLSLLLLQSPDAINQAFAGGDIDGDPIFRQFLGPEYRVALDQEVSAFNGATVELMVTVKARPLYSNVGLTDPVEKQVDFTLTARGTFMGVTRRVQTGYTIKVMHPAAPLLGKFFLFSPAVDAPSVFNVMPNDANGTPEAAQVPFAAYSTPVEQIGAGVDDNGLIAANAPAATIRGALADRGEIYLGAKGSSTLVNLTAGNAPTGEFFHLYSPAQYRAGMLYTNLSQTPDFFNPWLTTGLQMTHAYNSPDGNYSQYPYMSQIHFGFYAELDGDPVLGTSLTDHGRSSVLHLYGDRDRPSRAIVYGDVQQAVVRVGRIALQSVPRSGGAALTAPSATYSWVPYLGYCPTDAAYQADLSAEDAGQRCQYLASIRADFSQSATIPSTQPAFQLDPTTYNHRKMFGSQRASGDPKRPGYTDVMSTVLDLPYDEIIDAMRYPSGFPPHALLDSGFESALEKPYASYADVSAVTVPYRDALHAKLGAATHFSGDLSTFFASTGTAGSPVEQILRSRITRDYASADQYLSENLDSSNVLHLAGGVRIAAGDLVLGNIKYMGSGMIMLESGSIISRGVAPVTQASGELPGVLTLATLRGGLELAGGVLHQALFLAPQGRLTLTPGGGGPLLIAGALGVGSIGADAFQSGGSLSFLSATDPTRPEDAISPRYDDYYQVLSAQVPMSIERLP